MPKCMTQSNPKILFTLFQVFPRFFYVSDDSLLSILSNPKSVSSIKPHLVSLFGAIGNVIVTESSHDGGAPVITAVESIQGECLNLINPVRHIVILWGFYIRLIFLFSIYCCHFLHEGGR